MCHLSYEIKTNIIILKETRIGLGLAAIGRPEYINIRRENDEDKSVSYYKENAQKVLNFAYDQGVRDFDTAPSYGKGEQFLLDWYRQHQYKDVNLSTKWGYTYVANWEIGYDDSHEIKEHSLEKLTEQWSFSKQFLPGLKIYQIHSATFESGVLENHSVLKKLHKIKKEAGVAIGLSASGENQKEILEFASKIMVDNEILFESFQVSYNILETSTHDLLKKLLHQGKTVIIKEALANGRVFKNSHYPDYKNLYNVLGRIAKKYGVTVDAVALRYVIDHLQPSLVLSGASTNKQLAENLRAKDFKLEDSEISELNNLSVDSGIYWAERKELVWN